MRAQSCLPSCIAIAAFPCGHHFAFVCRASSANLPANWKSVCRLAVAFTRHAACTKRWPAAFLPMQLWTKMTAVLCGRHGL